ncbi:hypothetical protein [Niabella hibiscisoli]|uniref:hypothetical protein n=1 Tax=Niabella hibiscisoli TaxID=1825928 RepID=UPI001F0FB1CA|nr:hypothetical protein [Niabella hibiscisoli]MCH5718575.1 hypothetical protein [Niabella hibiscisoli]
MKSQIMLIKSLSLKSAKPGNTAPHKAHSPFWVIVSKEMADHIRSWRFIVLFLLIVLTFLASMYVSLGNLKQAMGNTSDPDHIFYILSY